MANHFYIDRESDQDAVNDPAVKGLLVEQAKHWTEFIEKQRKDEWSLTKTQLQVKFGSTLKNNTEHLSRNWGFFYIRSKKMF